MEKLENIAVLWDVENVTPDANSLFVDGLLEYINLFGRISIAKAFGNWTNQSITKLSNPLASKNFELYHIPKSRKNSSDISMITKGIEIAFQYPNIDIFILITGDVDFRPLVITLRKQSKRIHIVCDVKTASEDLLSLADSFKDYRELIPSDYDETDDDLNILSQEDVVVSKEEQENKLEISYKKLIEAIHIMSTENVKSGMGLVKIRVKMLNPSFDEKELGFKNWSEFIASAVEKKYVKLIGEESSAILAVDQRSGESVHPEFLLLLKVLNELGSDIYHYFPEVNKLLREKYEFSYKTAGYKKFRDFIQAAENRDLVTTVVRGLSHSVKIK